MSSTNRGTIRHPDDYYRTPAWCVHRLLDEVGERLPRGVWLEPWAGDGAIVEAVKAHDVKPWLMLANELDPDRAAQLPGIKDVQWWCGDYRDWDPPRGSVLISNPPYKIALECAEWALQRADVVCLLLRLNWAEGAKRAAFHRKQQPSVYVLPNRPSFTGKGTDSTAYAWFVWGLGTGGVFRVLDTTPKDVRAEAARLVRERAG